MSDTESPADVYWCARESSECVAGCIKRIRRYREALRASGRADRMRRAWMAYQGWGPRMDADASRVLPAGEQGEMVSINVNQFAALVNQAVVLTTANKVAVKAIPSNSDFESLAQAQLADSLNDFYERELGVAEREHEGALGMVLMSECWQVLDWDATAGPPAMVDEAGKPVPSGDVRVYCLTPYDMGVDPDVHDADSYQWVAFRRRVNKYELAAKYPNQAEKILATKRNDETLDAAEGSRMILDLRRRRSSEPESDCVFMWELRHLPTPQLPSGRLVRFLDDDCVLQDSVQTIEGQASNFGYPFPATDLLAYSAAPERVPGTPDGHTSFFDTLSLQEGVDLSASIMMSAINAGGMQNLYVPRGANVTATKLTGALNIVEYDGAQLPQAKENVAINPAVQAWAEMCVSWMRQRVSMNDVVMGEPSKGMPAQAMALLRAQAIEFHSHLQAAFERMVQRVRTGILRLLKKYAKTERVALIAGKANSWTLKHWSMEDLAGVDRFVVEPVNPIMKTLAGKVSFMQPLLESGKVTLQEYLDVVQTGRLSPTIRFAQDNSARIEREKEMLMQGIGVPPIQMMPGPMGPAPMLDAQGNPIFVDDGQPHIRPLITDTHWLDIPEYLGVLAMPEVRDAPEVVKAVTEAVHLKVQMWRSMDPAILMLLHGPPAPPLGMPLMPPQGPPPNGPPGQPPKPPGPTAGPENGPQVELPKPPPNPLS